MKGIKKISLLVLACSFALSVASCTHGSSKKKKSESDTIESTEVTGSDESQEVTGSDESQEVPADVTEETYKDYLSSLTLDTTNCKKEFYVGEEFTSEGLKVQRNIRRVYLDTSIQPEMISEYVDDYTIDTSAVDMNVAGTYSIIITYRMGTSNDTREYKIKVKSSLFESTPNITYASGLKARFSDDTIIKEFTLGSSSIEPISKSDIQLNLIQSSVDSNLNISMEEKSIAKTDVTIDLSTVDYTKVGSYLIKISYKAPDVTINGVAHENVVQTFLIVSIVNPVIKIEKDGGKNNFTYNVEYSAIDYFANSNWKLKLTHADGTTESVSVTPDLFVVEGMKLLYWDNAQTKVTIKLKEDESITYSIENKIVINAEGIEKQTYYDVDINDDKYVDGLGYQFKDATLYNGTEYLGTIYGPTRLDEKTYTDRSNNSDTFEGQKFETRCSIKGSAQYFSVVASGASESNPFTLVVYFATSGDEAREIVLYDTELEEEIDSAMTSSTKQEIVRKVFYITKDGTYRIYNSEGGVYIHGFMIVKAK